MKKKVWISLGVALAATLFMLWENGVFAVQPEPAPAVAARNEAPQGAPEASAAPAVQLKIDKTSLSEGGSITLTGAAPPGKPVYIELWADENVRASRFDSEPDKATGKRPYILYMTHQMPAYYKILTPADKQSTLTVLKLQKNKWSYSQALKDFGAETAFAAPAKVPIQRYHAGLLGSVVGSRGELLAALDAKENGQRAMQLIKARFRTPTALFAPAVDIKPDGTFSAKVTLSDGAPRGKYNVRAVAGKDLSSLTVAFENKVSFPYIYLSNAGTSINFIYPFLLCLAISIFGVLMGAGGGFILNPLLVSLWPLPHTVVAGTVMPTVLFSQGSGILNYSKIKFISWKLGTAIGLAMLLGGFIGPKLTELITLDQYKFVFGWILVVLSGLMLWQTTPAYLAKNSKEQAIIKQYRKQAEEAAALVKA